MHKPTTALVLGSHVSYDQLFYQLVARSSIGIVFRWISFISLALLSLFSVSFGLRKTVKTDWRFLLDKIKCHALKTNLSLIPIKLV